MKKLILLLIILGCMTSCTPKYWFYTKAAHPTDKDYKKKVREAKHNKQPYNAYDDLLTTPIF
jgi:hypothetical protein